MSARLYSAGTALLVQGKVSAELVLPLCTLPREAAAVVRRLKHGCFRMFVIVLAFVAVELDYHPVDDPVLATQ